jgi:hypothetical protein
MLKNIMYWNSLKKDKFGVQFRIKNNNNINYKIKIIIYKDNI